MCFFWKSVEYNGEIKLYSEDGNFLQKEAIRLKKENAKQPMSPEKKSPSKKSEPIKKKIFTPDDTRKESSNKRKQVRSQKENKISSSSSTTMRQEKPRSMVINSNKNNQKKAKLIIDEKESDDEKISDTEPNKKRKKVNLITDSDSDDYDNKKEDGSETDDIGDDKNEVETEDNNDCGGVSERASKNIKLREDINEDGDSKDESEQDDLTENDNDNNNDGNKNKGSSETGDKNKNSSETGDENKDSEVNNPKNKQLLDEIETDGMVELKNGILCSETVLDTAVDQAKEGTHLARRLLQGVFTMNHLKEATYTGLTPHAQGPECMRKRVVCLNHKRKKAIIDYVKTWCEEKGKAVPSDDALKKAMSQKLGEFRRQDMKNAEYRTSHDH